MMKPYVTVIIPTHLDENAKYLDLAVTTALQTFGVHADVIVVSSAMTAPSGREHPRLKTYHRPNLNNASVKVDFAMSMANPVTNVFVIMSDDVMVSRKTIERMATLALFNNCIVNPISNGDNGTRYMTHLNLMRKPGIMEPVAVWPIPVNLSLEDLEAGCPEYLDRILCFETGYRNLSFTQPWVSFYCTAIPKRVFEIVGPLDARMDVRHNDQDFCIRAAQKGIPAVIAADAFALHFGSRTLYKAHTKEEFDQASQVFNEKYGLR